MRIDHTRPLHRHKLHYAMAWFYANQYTILIGTANSVSYFRELQQ